MFLLFHITMHIDMPVKTQVSDLLMQMAACQYNTPQPKWQGTFVKGIQQFVQILSDFT